MGIPGWSESIQRHPAFRVAKEKILLGASLAFNFIFIFAAVIGIPNMRESEKRVIDINPQANVEVPKIVMPAEAPKEVPVAQLKPPDFVVHNGYRAITLMVDQVTGVEGFVEPGTLVDVVLTYYEQGRPTSKIISENVKVLSNSFTPDDKKNPANRPANFTLTIEVTPEEALSIQVAKHLGRMSLMLRAPSDTKGARLTSIDSRALKGEPVL